MGQFIDNGVRYNKISQDLAIAYSRKLSDEELLGQRYRHIEVKGLISAVFKLGSKWHSSCLVHHSSADKPLRKLLRRLTHQHWTPLKPSCLALPSVLRMYIPSDQRLSLSQFVERLTHVKFAVKFTALQPPFEPILRMSAKKLLSLVVMDALLGKSKKLIYFKVYFICIY